MRSVYAQTYTHTFVHRQHSSISSDIVWCILGIFRYHK